ncbi:retropepsin-like aspartic protease [Granulicella sp. L56]|uniref:retropepsin-like aspartic protease n=1 Tax=Granulicella sp. L56 TaxID=1747222 RepID=UPI00131C6CB7|nr:retropepsin-like aspartic protease [Granulicella sp. L56]
MRQAIKQHLVNTYRSFLAIWLLPGLCFAAQGVKDASIVPFVTLNGTLMVVQVGINGNGPYDFLLDTGATSSCIDEALVEALQLPHSTGAQVASTTGTAFTGRVILDRVNFGSREIGPAFALVRSLVTYKAFDTQIHGVLGQDVLSQLNYLIDNQHHRIEVDTDGFLLRNLTGEHIKMESVKTRVGGIETRDLFLTGLTDSSTHSVRLLLDSGTTHVMLRAAVLKVTVPPSKSKWVSNDSGRFVPASSIRTRLTIGGTKLDSEAWIIDDLLDHLAIDGLLPTGAFNALYVANQQSFVILNPQMRGSRQGRKLEN